MKRFIVYIVLDIISIMFLILGCALFFSTDKNNDNAILSKMYENFHSYAMLLINKFPILQSNPEIFGMGLLSFGLFLMAGAFLGFTAYPAQTGNESIKPCIE